MSRNWILGVGASALLASCGFPEKSNWHLIDSGYSIDTERGAGEFAIEVHLNQVEQLGGDIHGARFGLFVAESLKRHGVCPQGWTLLPCTDDGSCVFRTERSVTVLGRCLAS